jgi:hypothetical protein
VGIGQSGHLGVTHLNDLLLLLQGKGSRQDFHARVHLGGGWEKVAGLVNKVGERASTGRGGGHDRVWVCRPTHRLGLSQALEGLMHYRGPCNKHAQTLHATRVHGSPHVTRAHGSPFHSPKHATYPPAVGMVHRQGTRC